MHTNGMGITETYSFGPILLPLQFNPKKGDTERHPSVQSNLSISCQNNSVGLIGQGYYFGINFGTIVQANLFPEPELRNCHSFKQSIVSASLLKKVLE